MKSGKKTVVWFLGGIAVLILLSGGLVLLGPRFIHSDFAKKEIVSHLSRVAGGSVNYSQADFLFLPRPHLLFQKAHIAIDTRMSADTASLVVYPRIWPLFKGRVEIARLDVRSPACTVYLPAAESQDEMNARKWDVKALHSALVPFMAPAGAAIEGMGIDVQNGQVAFIQGGETIAEMHQIQLHMWALNSETEIRVNAASSVCKTLSLSARMDAGERAIKGQIEVKGLLPDRLPAGLVPEGAIQPGDEAIDAELAFRADVNQALKVDLQGSVPMLALVREQKKTTFKGTRFQGRVHLASDGLSASLSELHLERPPLELSGEMTIDAQPRHLELKLDGKGIDVLPFREAALNLAGNDPFVQRIFAIIREGQVPRISISANGTSVAEWTDLNHIHIKGRMENGRIFIPATGMDLADVNGDVDISDRGLVGTRLEARLGRTRGSNGTLKLGLADDDPAFHLDIETEADLEEALPIVQGLIHEGPLKQSLERVEQIQGNAKARLILGDQTWSLHPRMMAREFNLTARYAGIPWPLQVKGGAVSYANQAVEARQVDVCVGKSTVSDIAGTLTWHNEPRIETASGPSTLALDELYPWITSFAAAHDVLKAVSRLKGCLLLNQLQLKGPLFKPAAWRFKTDGRVKNVGLVSSKLPGPAHLTGGNIRADAQTIRFEEVGLRILDAWMKVSGRAEGYLNDLNLLEANIHDADIKAKALRYATEQVRLPERFRIKPPVAVNHARINWRKGMETAFHGDMETADGTSLTVKGVRTPGLFEIEHLDIRDAASHAAIRFRREPDAVGFGFSGDLSQPCLDSLLRENRFLTGWVKGDFWGRIVPGSPIESTVEGYLEGGDVSLRQLDIPATIRKFSVEAGQQRLRFNSDVLAMDDRQIGVSADIDLSDQGILVRTNVDADGIDLKRTLAAMEKLLHESEDQGNQPWSVPLKGTARIQLKRLTYGDFEWRPFHCSISAEGNTVRISVSKAALCGIATPGTVEMSPEKVAFHTKPKTQGMELAPTIACLTRETMKIGGTFDFNGDIRGEGRGEGLLRSLDGPIHFVSKNGRIDRFSLLVEIFSLLNITELFKGQVPDLHRGGFSYHTITVDGHLKDGKLELDHVLLDAPSMNIACTGHIDLCKKALDLTVFAAPFKTVDRILQMVPVVGYVLDYSLVSIAIKVTGDLKHPKVDYLPASMLGSSILGMMKRTLLAPVEVITPTIPKSGK